MRSVVVVGGGAAGMMAAIAAAGEGAKVTLIEKNEKLGKKLFITGKGRCNLTNTAGGEDFFVNVISNPKFLYSSFYSFDNGAVCEMIESAGCRLKEERGGRIFPVSDHSSDIISALKKILTQKGVEIRLNTKVKKTVTDDEGAVNGVRLDNGEFISADAVIICTGGLSYPSTGSDGDGYEFARETGHKVTQLRPALVPLNTRENWCRDLQGLSLKNAGFKMYDGTREVYDGFGEMLFTHFGISGPLVLSASSYIGRCRSKDIRCVIDLKPALDDKTLDDRLIREFAEKNAKEFHNALGDLLPSGMIPVIVELSEIAPDKKVSQITKEERQRLGHLLKNLELHVSGTRDYAEAIITQGGVSVKDINPSTMGSKHIKGLYFAGEVLDLDAVTGGFNLQIAWSTGHLAGVSAARTD